MKALADYRSMMRLAGLAIAATAGLFAAIPAFAQLRRSSAQAAAMSVVFLVMLLIFAAFYVYFALALQTIAKKTKAENDWLAWIPIVQIILALNIAKKPLWWFILCFVPLVNMVILILIWMAIAEARGKPNWWGILLIVPVVGLVVPGYLAWAD